MTCPDCGSEFARWSELRQGYDEQWRCSSCHQAYLADRLRRDREHEPVDNPVDSDVYRDKEHGRWSQLDQLGMP